MPSQMDGGTSWTERFRAWWEGYELPAAPAGASAPAPRPLRRDDGQPVSARSGLGLDRAGKPLWTATRVEVAEKLWGDGFTYPHTSAQLEDFLSPLGLTKEKTALDLAAGLGGACRMIAKQYGAWVTGLEPSPLLAEQGMVRSLKADLDKQAPVSLYDPETFAATKRYDGIIARELFFTVNNFEGLVDAIEASLKPGGTLQFTDYVRVGEPGPAFAAWAGREPVEPHPRTVEEITHALTQRNLDVRVAVDLSDEHRRLIAAGLRMFAWHLEKHTLDHATKAAVAEEVELWASRAAALQDGLRQYRFCAIKGLA